MHSHSHLDVLDRINTAIEEAKLVFAKYSSGVIAAEYKAAHDPVTKADKELDAVLRKTLLREGEGWLSEERTDDLSRLGYERVWIVDPLDGTRRGERPGGRVPAAQPAPGVEWRIGACQP